jgi:methionyl-tRNA synthetase
MSDKKAKYITTTLPYVNSSPHLGHALEFVQADTLARYYRILGHEVFFNTGVDEHGQKIAQKADEAGIDRQTYVDKYAAEFDNLKTALDLSYDSFIRTTSEKHKLAAKEMWRRCEASGDIYKKTYKGLYCVGCEAFKTESDLVDGKCPDHLVVPEEIEEENYFFRLSKYQTYLEEYLSNEKSTLPNFRRLELLNFVQGGLEDLSISRQKSRMDWGIEVPDDSNHVMYVWFDALTNYISCLDWPGDEEGKYVKFWQDGETLQLAGKDQLRFQSVIWQAMLKSAGLPATDVIFYHGFINSGGQKMSKSLGNTINPYEMVERYGTDATRYILLRHVHPFDDSDVTWEKMDEWYTANLVNGLGNLVARVMKMAETYEVTWKDYIGHGDIADNYHNYPGVWNKNWEYYNFQKVCDNIWEKITGLDVYIQREQPFKKIKINEVEAKNDVAFLLSHLLIISYELEPLIPDKAFIIRDAVLSNKKPENLFKRLEG